MEPGPSSERQQSSKNIISPKKVLIIEPFYGGSHKVLMETAVGVFRHDEYELITMSPKKWQWRARCSPLYLSQHIPRTHNYTHLFTSSVLPLAELIGMRPDLAALRKIVYFHENQLIYPVQQHKERDYQYGYNEITTCLAADVILFNSNFNKESFLNNIDKFLRMMPDYRPQNVTEDIEAKSEVIFFPLKIDVINEMYDLHFANSFQTRFGRTARKIVWNHRWEFDKNPGLFFKTLYRLKADGVPFVVNILGANFSKEPPEFQEAKLRLNDEILHFGYVTSQREYYKILLEGDIVVSTANQEFFGVSVAEAARCGCIPVLPNKLVYPEIYPSQYLYDTEDELYEMLKKLCLDKEHFFSMISELDRAKFLGKFDEMGWIMQFETYFEKREVLN